MDWRMLALILLLVPVVDASPALAAWPAMRLRNEARQQALRPRLRGIRLQRPRIFMTDQEIEATRKRIDENADLRETYGWLTHWAYSGQFYRNLWRTPQQLQGAVVAYRLEGRPPRLLANGLAIMDFLCTAQPDSWTYPRVVRALSMAYDWLYEDLTPAQRQKYGARIVECAKACYDTWVHEDLNNHLYLEYGPLLYAGIALYGEGIDDAAVEQFALDGMELLLDHFLPAHALLGQDGGWYESMSYHAFFTFEYAHLIELWRHASGENLWGSPGALQGDAEWQAYNARPWDESRVHVADEGSASTYDLEIADYLPLLWGRHRDGVARYWTEHLRAETVARRRDDAPTALSPDYWWPYLLWSDPAVTAVPRDRLPLARLFRGVGWASMRSSWQPDASFALFICSDWWGGHQHCDNNSFTIGKHAPLAIDSGAYDADTPHRANYSARTIAHNTVTVYDPEEPFVGGTWGGSSDQRVANDGGQLYGPPMAGVARCGPGTPSDRGEMLAFELTPQYTYAVGDATRSYRPTKVREFTRAFLHLRPDLFVVFDRVESTNASFQKRWLLHSISQPALAGRTITLRNGPGSLTCQTVYPPGARAVAVGGPGHEFEVFGQNFPTQKRDPEAGAWRVAVSPARPARRDYFLHVLRAGGATPVVPAARLVQRRGRLGVRVVDQGQTYEVEFATMGRLAGHVRVTDRADHVVDKDLATTLVGVR